MAFSLDFRLLFFAAILYISGILPLQAQENQYGFENISIQHGLSQVTVKRITQDSKGYMWFATDDGLNRFDGYSFTVFKNDPTDSTSISSNLINCMFEDRNKTFWIGTKEGLNKFDRKKEKFIRYSFKSNDEEYTDNIITSFSEDNNGNLWIGTFNGLKYLDTRTGKVSTFKHLPDDSTTLSNNIVKAVECDNNGNVWIGTEVGLNVLNIKNRTISRLLDSAIPSQLIMDIAVTKQKLVWLSTGIGIACYDSHKKRFINTQFPWIKSLSDFTSFSIFVDKSGKVWFGGGALSIYDPHKNVVLNYQNVDKIILGFQGNSILDVYEDKAGTFWVGTNSTGIIKFIPRHRKFYTFSHNPDKNSISENTVWDVYEDSEGWLWVSTNKGINLLNRTTQKWTTHFVNKDINRNIITSSIEDNKGIIWICTNGEGLVKFDKRSQKISKIYKQTKTSKGIGCNYLWKIAKDKEGNLWMGTIEGGLIKFNPRTEVYTTYQNNPDNTNSIGSNTVYAIFVDSKGIVWIGTDGVGLDRFDPKTETFIHYKNNPKKATSLSNNTILSISEDTKGNIWIGTNGGGLNMLDPSSGFFKVYREKDGLCNDAVYGVVEDNWGKLWISTNKGVSKFDPVKEVFKNYDAKDGLQSNEFNSGSFFRNKNGKIYFGGINGFNCFYPDSIKDNPEKPEVVLTDLSIFNKKVKVGQEPLLRGTLSQTDTLILSYKETFITIEFAALNYTSPEKNQYAYKLEGFDKEWYYIGDHRAATYTNLEPGTYTFRVKASNNHGVWNEEGTALTIIIDPPFWKTSWFNILAAVLIVSSAVIFYRIRINLIRNQKKELEREVIARTQDLTEANEKIKELYREVKDSIRAAETIQLSVLPSQKYIRKHLPEVFVLNKPKDIVSGDFYWFDAINDKIIIACVDSTGHGVSGAFMSMLGHSLLNQSIYFHENSTASEILDRLHNAIIVELHRKNEESEIQDGMDIALCIIDQKENKLQFAGASRPLYLLREKEIIQVKGNRYPIGITLKMDVRFDNHEIELKEGDVVYLFSDGYADQFGGNHGEEKFQYFRFRELLKEIGSHSMETQLKLLDQHFREWKGKNDQMDDVMVIGFKPVGVGNAVQKQEGDTK